MYRIGYEAFQFKPKDKLLFKIDPRVKLLISIILMIYGLTLSNIISSSIYFISLLVYVSLLGGIFKKILKNMMVLTPLLAIIFIANYIVLFDVVESLIPVFKLLNLVISLNIFFLTTSPDDFSITLERLGFPITVTLSFSLALRFIILLAKQLNEIVDAQLSRGYSLDRGNLITRIRNYIPIIIPLIVLSIKKSIDVAETLEVRGFRTDVKHIPYNDLRIDRRDILFIMFNLGFIGLIYILLSYIPIQHYIQSLLMHF